MKLFDRVYLKAPSNMRSVRTPDGSHYLADAHGFMHVRREHVQYLLTLGRGFEYKLEFQPRGVREEIERRRALDAQRAAAEQPKPDVPVAVANEDAPQAVIQLPEATV